MVVGIHKAITEGIVETIFAGITIEIVLEITNDFSKMGIPEYTKNF